MSGSFDALALSAATLIIGVGVGYALPMFFPRFRPHPGPEVIRLAGIVRRKRNALEVAAAALRKARAANTLDEAKGHADAGLAKVKEVDKS